MNPEPYKYILGGSYGVLWESDGGMGNVYICEESITKKKIAVKTPKSDFKDNTKVLNRFTNEAKLWMSLGYHDHIIWAQDLIIYNNLPYLLLEYGGGWTLREWIDAGKLSQETFLDISLKIANGMAYANKKVENLVHCDIKPQNIMLKVWKGADLKPDEISSNLKELTREINNLDEKVDDPELVAIQKVFGVSVEEKIINAKITDFGLARISEEISTPAEIISSSKKGKAFPSLSGTLPYMSPEQCLGQNLHSATDVYSYGIMLYEMIAGKFPYEFTTPQQIIDAHINQPVIKFQNTKFPVEEVIIDKVYECLHKEPNERPTFENLKTFFENFCIEPNNKVKSIYSIDGLTYPEPLQKLRTITAQIKMGNVEETLEQFNKMDFNDDIKSTSLGEVGAALREAGRIDLALIYIENALKIDSNNVSALNELAVVKALSGEIHESIIFFDKCISMMPDDPKFLVNKGVILCDYINDFYGALDLFDNALKLDSQLLDAWINKGIVLSKLGRPIDAIKTFEEAIEIDPENTLLLLRFGATLNDHLKEHSRALEVFNHVISLNPNLSEAWYDRGVACEALGNIYEAIESYHMVHKIDSSDSACLNNLGVLYFNLGDYRNAAKFFEQLVRLCPDDLEAINKYNYSMELLQLL